MRCRHDSIRAPWQKTYHHNGTTCSNEMKKIRMTLKDWMNPHDKQADRFSVRQHFMFMSWQTKTQEALFLNPTFSVGWRAFGRYLSALERGYSAHIDPRLPVCRRRRIGPLYRVVYPASVGLWVFVLTAAWPGHQRQSGWGVSGELRRTAQGSRPLQGDRVGGDLRSCNRAVILAVCCKGNTLITARWTATRWDREWDVLVKTVQSLSAKC